MVEIWESFLGIRPIGIDDGWSGSGDCLVSERESAGGGCDRTPTQV
ncbi:hypothetical protein [Adonisia turfae]|nr:hypothetical protein [Adonisia turfae]